MYLLVAIVAWAVAQALKVVTHYVNTHQLDMRQLTTSGGMPSSHATLVVSLSTAIAIKQGVNSPFFAISAIFAAIVMYDAAGVRRAAGRQAQVLNRILDDILHQHGLQEERLRELIGHTPVQVLVGALLGLTIALLMVH